MCDLGSAHTRSQAVDLNGCGCRNPFPNHLWTQRPSCFPPASFKILLSYIGAVCRLLYSDAVSEHSALPSLFTASSSIRSHYLSLLFHTEVLYCVWGALSSSPLFLIFDLFLPASTSPSFISWPAFVIPYSCALALSLSSCLYPPATLCRISFSLALWQQAAVLVNLAASDRAGGRPHPATLLHLSAGLQSWRASWHHPFCFPSHRHF